MASATEQLNGLAAATPVIIGAGQVSERCDARGYRALSAVGLASAAASVALSDAGLTDVADSVDTVAAVRQFEVSTPFAVAPLGCSDNFPRSVSDRSGLQPQRAVLDVSGGQSPQKLVNEFAAEIASGRSRTVLIVGAEAISTVRQLADHPDAADFTEHRGGQLEDRGYGLEGVVSSDALRHGLTEIAGHYALFEHARRASLGLSRHAYACEMGRLFAPFTAVAAGNPHAAAPVVRTAEELTTVSPRNRVIADPYPRYVVARDQVNQAAAVLLTSVGHARTLGVDPRRLVFLHGHCDAVDKPALLRPDLGRSEAAVEAVRGGLDLAGLTLDEITLFDFYSCFPIALFNVCDGLGLDPLDPRGLTVTGGLPFFGGPGNNYSLHAIVEMVGLLRERGMDAHGLVGANGGVMSKYSVGVYGTFPRPWQAPRSAPVQARLDERPSVDTVAGAHGPATIETFTIIDPTRRPRAAVVARSASGARFYARVDPEDSDTMALLCDGEPIGQSVRVTSTDGLNTVRINGDRPPAP